MKIVQRKNVIDSLKMSRPAKRIRKPSVEEQVALYLGRVITRDEAFSILSKAEVRDAMTWVIGAVNDPRFANIAALMREENIWQYWTRRDMPEVLGDGTLPWQTSEEGVPSWKVVYLWFRLACSFYQRFILADYQSQPEKIHGAFPPGTVLRLKHLNVIEMTVPDSPFFVGETYELDFKSQFQRIMRDAGMVKPGGKDAVMYYDEIVFIEKKHIIALLSSMYPKLTREIVEIYAGYIDRIFLNFGRIIKESNWRVDWNFPDRH
jgi:hypothetical protein